MTQISKAQVLKIAQLAQLKLSPQEIDIYQRELGVILDFSNKLQAVSVNHLEATEQVTNLTNITRIDEIDANLALDLKDLEKNAPNFIDRQFAIPKITH
ncbi:MAG: Asp-tRNA(Asn)/Glu-tRNA(Gln) amidotransferase subunit GatC [Candidatus Saccharibacteria bacterium]|nr:Asp-tRNA(Asn)/Glu-tRNA(Gln) amidotransferase subunit GatC [Candidatus Saccharibacteria bacterium]